jgi:hypothetical protein
MAVEWVPPAPQPPFGASWQSASPQLLPTSGSPRYALQAFAALGREGADLVCRLSIVGLGPRLASAGLAPEGAGVGGGVRGNVFEPRRARGEPAGVAIPLRRSSIDIRKGMYGATAANALAWGVTGSEDSVAANALARAVTGVTGVTAPDDAGGACELALGVRC